MHDVEKRLQLYLRSLATNGGSDLHIKSGTTVRMRVSGDLRKLGKEVMTTEEIDQLCREILTEKQYKALIDKRSSDFTYVMGVEKARFRANIFFQTDGMSCVFRIIPVKILTMEELNLPKALEHFTKLKRGLVAVTGITGSGKSTTLAAMIDRINRTQKKHIITVEDPIEFVHKDRECLVNQRGIGPDALSFHDALRGALREDPDIILVGEMRDLETIEIGLHAANTGHLVFSTLHTKSAEETIDRIIGMFAKEEQPRIRLTVAASLEGVVAQRLVKTINGGRAAAIEILINTGRVGQLIAENRDAEITDALAEGKEIYGTQTFDQAILDLFFAGRVNEEEALGNASNPSDMKLKMQGVGGAVAGKAQKIEIDDDVFDVMEDEH
ncbi:MAG: pilin biogenesis [Sulfurovum sp. FS08-3]|nr:MAG: pilin biogenesis [Sulfurovum sp. PC08-66]KIM12254.1 MAG: pilin biogenesis [Sulfurovum sp. FS08-3]